MHEIGIRFVKYKVERFAKVIFFSYHKLNKKSGGEWRPKNTQGLFNLLFGM